jgi:hypothetical protein
MMCCPSCLSPGEEALFDEEFTEEEVLGELAPLTVLLAFLLLSSGRAAAALDKLQPLVAGDIHAREIAALAANNWAVASYMTGGWGGRGQESGCNWVFIGWWLVVGSSMAQLLHYEQT